MRRGEVVKRGDMRGGALVAAGGNEGRINRGTEGR